MTPEHKLSIASAFRAARIRISQEINTFICPALGGTYHPARYEAIRIIAERMGTSPRHGYGLETWLRVHHNIPYTKLTWTRMRAYRLAWLDALIKEFDPEGVTA